MKKLARLPNHELRPLIAAARRQQWELRATGSGHLQLIAPTGARVMLSSSPSCPFAVKKVRAALKRAGLQV